MVLRVGLTGGIGAGKSAVCARLAERGAVVVDADRIAREVVAPGTEGLREVVAAFGDDVLAVDGGLDRPALGAIVFADENARRRLEAIVHPRVRARSAELIGQAPPDAIVVNDVPLLVEAGLAPTYHLVIVVEAARSTRVDRLVHSRNMTPEQANERIAAQADDARRRAAADVVLVNDGDLADLYAAVDPLWHERLVPYEHNLRLATSAHAGPRVALVEPDPAWPAQFERLAARIRHALGAQERRIDHVGSTAVPGMAARDIIDIQLTVTSMADADDLAERLSGAGLPRCPGQWWDAPRHPDRGTARWEKRLHGGADPGRAAAVHLRVGGSPGWRFALLMRDHLRADPHERAGYLALKRALAAESPDADTYATGKDPWFDEENVLAEQWAAVNGWQP